MDTELTFYNIELLTIFASFLFFVCVFALFCFLLLLFFGF